MKRFPPALAAILAVALLAPMSGCVDVRSMKDGFFEEPATPAPFENRTVESIEYTFQSGCTAVHTIEESWRFRVKEDARYLSGEVGADLLSGNADVVFRFELLRPDGSSYFDVEYTQTGSDKIPPITNPEPGIWIIEVSAQGYNDDESHYDAFRFDVVVDQPGGA